MSSICSKKNCIYACIGSDKKTEVCDIDNEFIKDRECVCDAYSNNIVTKGNIEDYKIDK